MTTKDDVIRGQEWAGMALVRENERLRAEVERDERRFRETEAEWVDRFQALEAEVERLRSLKAGTVTVELANGLFGSDKYVPEQRARELEAEVERLRARLAAAERLIEVVRTRDIGTAGGVGAAFEAYDSIQT